MGGEKMSEKDEIEEKTLTSDDVEKGKKKGTFWGDPVVEFD